MTDPTRAAELTAAVARLRQLSVFGGSKTLWEVYEGGPQFIDRCFEHDKQLALADYLATVAADDALRQRLQADAKYFDEAAAWAKKQWNEQAASMAKEAADRFRAALNIAQPSEQE